MANYAKTNIGNEGRVELHEMLGLTGAEVSVNKLPAGAGVPFVHAHKDNEEIYGVLEGAGSATIDGEDIELAAGDWLRVSPAAHRQFRAASDSGSVSRSSRGPSTPSRPTTLSCSNSRSAARGANEVMHWPLAQISCSLPPLPQSRAAVGLLRATHRLHAARAGLPTPSRPAGPHRP